MHRPLLLLLLLLTGALSACPMCSPMELSLSEDIELAEAVVLAEKIVKKGSPGHRFRVTRTLKGEVPVGKVLVAGSDAGGAPKVLLFTAGSADSSFWTGKPYAADSTVEKFALGLVELPSRTAKGSLPKRLDFMLNYLHHPNSDLAGAAVDEFSRAPYDDVGLYAARLGRAKVAQWVNDPTTPDEHLALFFVMLGKVGTATDLPAVERRLKSSDEQELASITSPLIACYLSLKGPAGLPRIEKEFLAPGVPPRKLRGALEALRFHANYATNLERKHVLPVFQRLLDDPKAAGFVLRDLALWEDWQSVPKVAMLFDQGTGYQTWLKTAVIRFLITAPTEEAKVELERIRQKDPKLVKSVQDPYRRYPGEPG